jgi:hypothetical protein
MEKWHLTSHASQNNSDFCEVLFCFFRQPASEFVSCPPLTPLGNNLEIAIGSFAGHDHFGSRRV